MKFTRRFFVKSSLFSLIAPLLSGSPFRRTMAEVGRTFFAKFPRARAGENLFLTFNNIKDPEGGESDEFTSIRRVQALLAELGISDGTTVIGIGARTGSPSRPYATPGEMGYLWKMGEPWTGKVTSHIDASPVPLLLDDPIVVTQVGVLHESTAHHFEINDPSLEGSVLWTLYHDDTGSPTLGVGMHNLFSDVDGGLLEDLYDASRAALSHPNSWMTDRVRNRLITHIPDLRNNRVWDNFSSTLSNPFIHSRWLPYVRRQGWKGAAIVLRGSMENVTQFHLKEWVRKSPAEPEFEIGKGTHTSLKIKAGREARPFITHDDKTWTMVGFIWDLEASNRSTSMKTYRDFSDIFGQDFHIHGFSQDGTVGGHTLCALLGAGKLSVSLYPLTFERNATAFLFNNDLKIVPSSVAQSSAGLTVQITNSGENFARNVSVRLDRRAFPGVHVDPEDVVVPLMRPGQTVRVQFRGAAARRAGTRRRIRLDRDGHFLEGGSDKANNVVEVS